MNLAKFTKIIFFILFFAEIIPGYCTHYQWQGDSSSVWRNSNNWSPNGIPGTTDTVTITDKVNDPVFSQDETIGRLVMTSGSLNLGGYTITLNTSSKFTSGSITGSASKAIKPRGSRSLFEGTTIDAEVEAISNDVVLSGSTFNKPCYFEQTGSSTGNGLGGNTFNAPSTFKNGGTAYFILAATSGNVFQDSAIFICTGAQEIVASKAKSYFNGPIVVSSSNGGVNFGAATEGDTVFFSAATKISIGSGGFSAGTLALIKVFQNGTQSHNLTLTGSAVLNINTCVFNGPFTAVAPSPVVKFTTFNDSLSLTKTGPTAALAAGGNTFNGITYLKNHCNVQWRFANETGDTYKNKVTFVSDSTGQMRPFYNGTNFVTGDLIALGTKVEYAASTGTVVLNGLQDQLISGEKGIDFYRLRINKASGDVNIDTTVSVNDSLNLVYGHLITSSNHLLVIKYGSKISEGSISAFIEGPLKKIGNTAFTFPIGEGVNFSPLKISAPTNTTDAFVATYFNKNQNLGTAKDTTIGLISTCSYWTLERSSGTSYPLISLGWDSLGCGIADTTGLKIINWNGVKWIDKGRNTLIGNALKGLLEAGTSTVTFSTFTIAANYVPNTFIVPNITGTIIRNDIPKDFFGFNGSNVTNNSKTWYELYNSSPPALDKTNITFIRIPAGTNANYHDWRSAWGIREEHLPYGWSYLQAGLNQPYITTLPVSIPNEFEQIKYNSNRVVAKTIACLNLMTSSFEYQLASLYRMRMVNLNTDYIELGNEFYLNNEQYKEVFPSVKDYANMVYDYCSRLKAIPMFENSKIAVVGAYGKENQFGRRKYWNKELLKIISPNTNFDAITLHQYVGSGLGSSVILNSTCERMFRTPFNDWDDFTVEIDEIASHSIILNGGNQPEIWVTEFGLHEPDQSHHVLGTWAHGLYVAAMAMHYLETPLITQIISHTMSADAVFGNLFNSATGYSGVPDNQIPIDVTENTPTELYGFTAAGAALNQFGQAVKGAQTATNINFGTINTLMGSNHPVLYGGYSGVIDPFIPLQSDPSIPL